MPVENEVAEKTKITRKSSRAQRFFTDVMVVHLLIQSGG
jgi:hypothetical protein